MSHNDENKFLFIIYILNSKLVRPAVHKYTNVFFPMFSIYLLQLFQCYPSLCHMSATPLFSFHLKQVQYATTPSNLDSLEGEAGEGKWVGVLKEGVWGKREEKQVKSSKEPLPCTSFSISYVWLFVFPGWSSLSPQLVCVDVFRATPGPLRRLRPLAKRRTYWLS